MLARQRERLRPCQSEGEQPSKGKLASRCWCVSICDLKSAISNQAKRGAAWVSRPKSIQALKGRYTSLADSVLNAL
jgi:hypothetical protein